MATRIPCHTTGRQRRYDVVSASRDRHQPAPPKAEGDLSRHIRNPGKFCSQKWRPNARIVTLPSTSTVSASSPDRKKVQITGPSMLKRRLRRGRDLAAFIPDSSRRLNCNSNLPWMIAQLRNGSRNGTVLQRRYARRRGGQNGTDGTCRHREWQYR